MKIILIVYSDAYYHLHNVLDALCEIGSALALSNPNTPTKNKVERTWQTLGLLYRLNHPITSWEMTHTLPMSSQTLPPSAQVRMPIVKGRNLPICT